MFKNKSVSTPLDQDDRFSCILIGKGDVIIHCAEQLTSCANLKAIFSPSSKVKAWCESHRVMCYPSIRSEESRSFLSSITFDYLFSFNNDWVIDDVLLQQPQKLAINYHNALLPHYGGVHAVFWAIYNEEICHGATIHIMEKGVDEGAVLLQETIAIDSQETALSLNMKCQEAFLVRLFPQLIQNIQSGTLHPIQQQGLDQSTFHRLKDKINPVVRWDASAKSIERMCRALYTTQQYVNRLGIPQFIYKGDVFFFQKVDCKAEQESEFQALPGQIVAITTEYLRIATGQGDILIPKILDTRGDAYDPLTFASRYGVSVGTFLPTITQKAIDLLLEYRSSHHAEESFWQSQFRALNEKVVLPFHDLSDRVQKSDVAMAQEGQGEYTLFSAQDNISPEMLAVTFLLYLVKIQQIQDFSIGLLLSNEKGCDHGILSYVIPFSMGIESEKSYSTLQADVLMALKHVMSKGAYFFDLPLRTVKCDASQLHFSLLLNINDSNPTFQLSNRHPWIIDVNEAGIKLRYHLSATSRLLIDALPTMADSFGYFLMQEKDTEKSEVSFSSLQVLSPQTIRQEIISPNINAQVVFSGSEECLVHSLFEAEARKMPDAIALRFEGQALSYALLEARSNEIAVLLMRYETTCGLIPICVERSFEMIIGILAILKSGNAYVPIDPDHPEHYINGILREINPAVLLTQQNFQSRFAHNGPNSYAIVCLDQIEKVDTKFEDNKIKALSEKIITPQNLAYVIYTSGTTGNPKGVSMTHKSLVNRLNWMKKQYVLQSGECMLHKTPFVFDWSFTEIFLPLISGASLTIAKPKGHKDSAYLQKILENESIHYLHFVPSMLSAFLTYLHAGNPYVCFSTIRCLFLSGENIHASLMKQAQQVFPNRIENLYGPTEGGEVSYDAGEALQTENVPLGIPIANSELYVLDTDKNPLPVGGVGILYIGGSVLGDYWKNPEKTRERFFENPFYRINPLLSNRLYCTGDLSRRLPNGKFELLGRADDQIKIRGMRVEISGVKNQLESLDPVQQSIVVKQQEQLVAYILPKSGKTINHEAIRKALFLRLPAYMVPSVFVTLDRFPVTHNGKIDYRALPTVAPEDWRLLSDATYVPPKTPLQVELVSLWKRLLFANTATVPQIGIQDSFYSLGGNSIATTYLFAEIKRIYECGISLTDFLRYPTVELLSHHIQGIAIGDHRDDMFSRDLEIALYPEIVRIEKPRTPSEFKGVLLTGVTGFLGAHLLNDLLNKTKADIYCLIRAENMLEAITKLNDNFQKYYPFDSLEGNERIKIVLGDLSKSRLGLLDEDWEEVGKAVDAIYHNGAQVHHLFGYEQLRPTNVGSTLELLKLAVHHSPKRFYYISTLSVVDKACSELMTEHFPSRDNVPPVDASGYLKTKWMSEYYLSQAAARGISVTIFRPSWITGQRGNGTFAVHNDHLAGFIKACIQLGKAPDLPIKLSMIPVDFISQLIVRISLQEKELDKVFNLSNMHLIEWRKLIEWVRAYGYPVEMVGVQNWFKQLQEVDQHNAMYPLLTLYQNTERSVDRINHAGWPAFNHNLDEFLKTTALEYPLIDDALLRKYFEHFHQCQFIKRPEKRQIDKILYCPTADFMLFSDKNSSQEEDEAYTVSLKAL